MSDYRAVKGGKLKLKGNKNIFKSDKEKKRKRKADDDGSKIDPDLEKHGGWWAITDEVDVKGGNSIAMEVGDGSNCYLSAMDNGKFTLGAPHTAGEGPAPEEILAIIRTPDDSKISLKTGYGKYVGVDSEGHLVAVADAVGLRERLEVVFQEGKTAVQSVANSCFLSLKPDSEGYIYVSSKTAKENEIVLLRTIAEKTVPTDYTPADDRKKAKECETAYVKMYQHSKVVLEGKHISIDVNDKKSVRKAQKEGNLHEHLLDRRMKMKSDKWC